MSLHSYREQPDEVTSDRALAWYLRLKDPIASRADRQAFQAWLKQSEKHRAAYAEVERLWGEVEGPARLLAGREVARRSRRGVVGLSWAVAACLVVTLCAGFGLWRDPGMIDRVLADQATAPGEIREMVLADGSRLMLDTDSAVDIAILPGARELKLRRGRVWLEVAPDESRPFTVTAGDVAVTVVGTRFAVERQGDDIAVLVAEGRVAVESLGGRSSPGSLLLGAAQSVEYRAGTLSAPTTFAADTRLAWTRGYLIFDQSPLDEVAVQLQRWLPGRVLFDERLSQHRLSGSFPIDDPAAILTTLETSLGLHIRRLPGALWLSPPEA